MAGVQYNNVIKLRYVQANYQCIANEAAHENAQRHRQPLVMA
jgi:hypothetical protein